jgi:thiol:disulfide interchange protein DsbC
MRILLLLILAVSFQLSAFSSVHASGSCDTDCTKCHTISTDALILGDKKAANKVIVFTDPDCPFCGKLHEEIKKVVEKRKDIAFYIKLFPLTNLHPDAYWKSKSIICGKSLKLLEDNFKKKSIPKPACETDVLDRNIKLAASLGISGTPTLVMPNGSVLTGSLQADKLIELVDSAKKKGANR